jgi:hypothetical protein
MVGFGVSSVMKPIQAASDAQAPAANAMDSRPRARTPNLGTQSYRILVQYLTGAMGFLLTRLRDGASNFSEAEQ